MLVQGNLAKNNLFENLKMICYLTKFVPYKTETIKQLNKNLEILLNKEKTYTVFTSPSGFLSFENLYDVNKTSIISIGETTSSFIDLTIVASLNLSFKPLPKPTVGFR